ncbi:DUF2637 domain-containing protein [Streptomyces sp. bgisy100]|uniref:DUF2637 domain-containing protein n=1 Tax=Streptomyces sp. bgisy100 TaxID=3413783 RepID=UPI003D721CB0
MAVAAFALSYDALRQMAAASHIYWLLTYAFPLVIDGFIAIGIGALLVLRTASVRPRLYVAALVGIATATSIWANVLHAIRLNQQTGSGGLALDDITVGVISAIAPLALAGAVHLYLLVQRCPTPTDLPENLRHITVDTAARGGAVATSEPTPAKDVAHAPVEQVARPMKPTAAGCGRKPIATFEEAVEIGRTAPAGRKGQASRRSIEKAIRDKGLGIGRERLEKVKDFLQAELDQDRDTTSA